MRGYAVRSRVKCQCSEPIEVSGLADLGSARDRSSTGNPVHVRFDTADHQAVFGARMYSNDKCATICSRFSLWYGLEGSPDSGPYRTSSTSGLSGNRHCEPTPVVHDSRCDVWRHDSGAAYNLGLRGPVCPPESSTPTASSSTPATSRAVISLGASPNSPTRSA